MPNGQPSQLANLRPWQPGESGNPGGRPKGVVYPVEYLKSMGDMTQEELEAIRDDPAQSINRRAAAEMALQSVDTEATRKDRREAFSEIADRTTGRAHQHQTLSVDTTPNPQLVLDQVKQQLGTDAPPQLDVEPDEHGSSDSRPD